MQMISFVFFAFLAVVYFGIILCNRFVKQDERKIKLTKWIFLLTSYLFIGYADLRFALVLAALTVIIWLCARFQKYIFVGVAAALLALAYFKYTNFFVTSFGRILGRTDYNTLNIVLPLGISFYTFSAISYLVDVSRGKAKVRSLLDVAIYLAFFPKITSGPIQRSEDFFTQINTVRHVGWESFSEGIQIFCIGLFKKLVLADHLSVFVNQVYEMPQAFSGGSVMLAVLAYSLQIYFDFSGYSDIAIGVARVLDIRLPRNFNLPYLSHNVTEFWKRWHISLSSWLQEYLYISLGGNRKGTVRTYWNLILTMLLGGLWHGASWTYVVWGLFHGFALAVHKIWAQYTGSREKQHSLVSNVFSILITFVFTSVCWIFFRAETIDKAFLILSQIFSMRFGVWHPYMWLFFGVAILLVGSIVAFAVTKNKTLPEKRKNQSYVEGFYPILDLSKFWHLVLFFVLCGLIVGMAYTGGSPFIYGAY